MTCWTDETYTMVSEFVNKYLAMTRQLGAKAYVGKDVDDCMAQTEARESFNRIYSSLREESERRGKDDHSEPLVCGVTHVDGVLYCNVLDRVSKLLCDYTMADTDQEKTDVAKRMASFIDWSKKQKKKYQKRES